MMVRGGTMIHAEGAIPTKERDVILALQSDV